MSAPSSIMAENGLDLGLLKRLIKKYGNNVYTMYVEYPHKSFWSNAFDDTAFRMALEKLFANDKQIPLMLYTHIPFCPKQCFFCTCYSVVTKNYEAVKQYMRSLFGEIDLLCAFFQQRGITPNFTEIHLGGGSPTYLNESEFDLLIEKLELLVDIKRLKEFTIEVDPRAVTKEKLKYYHQKGLSRISLGVQDFDLDVQKAVNRVQPPGLIEALLTPEIRKYFTSGINFDIPCGLPRQTRASFKKTIDKLIELSPDRTCVIYVNYALDLKAHQRLINQSMVPDFYERSVLFHDAAVNLLNNGYERIGFDHFAKKADSLAKAMREKSLHWNGLGYRAGKFLDIIGIGASSASRMTEYYYSQNFYEIENYEAAIANNKFPVYRGYKLDGDIIIRRDVIHRLRSYFCLDFADIEKAFNIDFNEYFKEERFWIDELAKDGIIELSGRGIIITEMGKYFTFLVCRIFDKLNRIKIG